MTTTSPAQTPDTSLHLVIKTWFPLALSWLLMSVEGPAHSAIVARLADPSIHLAAWGGIVFPIALIIEAPIIMMLSASTALSKDWDSFRKVRRFMMVAGAALTVVHIVLAFTPLYYIVVGKIIGAPEEIIEPGRIGLMIMLPWTWCIAYRRFHQGAMIRFGHSGAVGVGTVIRLVANFSVLAIGYWIKTVPGIIVASSAVAAGVVAEAIYAGVRIKPIIQDQIRTAPRSESPLTVGSFLKFYVPLALTSIISYFVSPLGSAAMSRMPEALDSLAVWPVLSGLSFMLRSACMAYNEVMVALLDRTESWKKLYRFAIILAIGSSALILLIALTPLSDLWMSKVMALPENLLNLANTGLVLAIPLPLAALLSSWFQGILVHSKQTRSISEAVIIYIVVIGGIMLLGIQQRQFPGLYVTMVAYVIASYAQNGWLLIRSRKPSQIVKEQHGVAANAL